MLIQIGDVFFFMSITIDSIMAADSDQSVAQFFQNLPVEAAGIFQDMH